MDSAYLNKIQQLVELQKVDDEIFEVMDIIRNTPEEVTALEKKFAEIETRRSQILDKLEHLEEQKKRLAIEMEDESARLKKSRNKLMQVANPREYQAMLREMDNMEKASRNREEEKLAILETVQLNTNDLNEIDKEFYALKEELENKRNSLAGTLKEANERLAVLQKKREEAATQIPEKVYQRYEFIRKRLEHPVIVDVEDGICSGCNIAVPPQVFIDLQSSEQIQNCPNCQRIIFWSEHFQMPNRKRRPKISMEADEPEENETPDENHEREAENSEA